MDDLSHRGLGLIEEAVCRHFCITVRGLHGPRRTPPLTEARCIAMALGYAMLQEVTSASIANRIGRKRGAVKEAVKRVNAEPELLRAFHLIKKDLSNDPAFRQL